MDELANSFSIKLWYSACFSDRPPYYLHLASDQCHQRRMGMILCPDSQASPLVEQVSGQNCLVTRDEKSACASCILPQVRRMKECAKCGDAHAELPSLLATLPLSWCIHARGLSPSLSRFLIFFANVDIAKTLDRIWAFGGKTVMAENIFRNRLFSSNLVPNCNIQHGRWNANDRGESGNRSPIHTSYGEAGACEKDG